jgi:DNA-binding SARP family transcriptional activator
MTTTGDHDPGTVPGLEIHLLGKPRVEQSGNHLPSPRGYKAWGLLAYMTCADRPPTRDELVSQLFSEADDPSGALRWNLSELRRVLPGAELGGDPVKLALPDDAFLDVAVLSDGSWSQALAVPGLDRVLLEGVSFSSSPAYEIWLVTQRRHLGALAEAVLREAALARLGAGDAQTAIDLSSRLVRMNPLEENFQALLVRSLAAGGDGVGAARQAARCKELFRRELGIDPSPAVTAASQAVAASPTTAPVSGRAAATAQLEAGEAAIAAGALESGLHCLRRALADARAAAATELQARALVALGSALVHAARGRDEEAAAALHEALAIADRAELAPAAAAASRELGYVEFLRGRYERAEGWLLRAADFAVGDVAERGRIASVLGSALSDTAHYDRAVDQLRESIELCDEAGDTRQVSYSQAMIGRVHLLRGELDAAAAALDESLETARADNWAAFTPWPESLRADADMLTGDVESAAGRYEHAFALGCQLGDPCWEGISARGVGVVAAARGEVQKAMDWLADARRRCVRLPDAYLWVEAYILEALCSVAVENEMAAAARWIEELEQLAARGGMRDLAVRACVHRARLGDASALEAARMLAAGIESPTLTALLVDPVGAGSEPAGRR